jgi:hypothetical protein
MALNVEEYQSLVNVGLVQFYEDRKDMFRGMAKSAYDHTKSIVAITGLDVRVDDVITILEPALKILPTLLTYLSGKKLTQKYWFRRLGDLVLDDLWKELTA